MYYVYIIYSEKLKRYYKGQTNDLNERIRRHNSGLEKYTKSGMPWVLIWKMKKESRSEAMLLERKLKNLSESRLLDFISKYK